MEFFLSIANVRVEVYEAGTFAGSPILFLHGNSLNANIFHEQLHAPELQGYRLISLDLPGHGQSPAAPGQYGLPALRAIVHEVVQLLDLEYALVVAHSLSGLLLYGLLPELPQLRGLMTVGAPPVSTAADVQAAFRADETVMLYYTPEVTATQIDRMARYALRPAASDAEVRRLAAAIERTDGPFRPELGASLAAGELADEVGYVATTDVPLAFVAGSLDHALQLDYFESVAAPSRWGSPVHLIPETRHSPFVEDPTYFNRLLLDFAAATAGRDGQDRESNTSDSKRIQTA
jgi:pimeloyl-ACP methyl ester carboxylesterase